MFKLGQNISQNEYNLICEKSDNFLISLIRFKEIFAVSELHITRRRTDIKGNFTGLIYFKNWKNDLISIFKNIYYFLLFCFKAMPIARREKINKKVKFLFVSHYTGETNDGKFFDSYFGNIIQQLEANGEDCLVAYIDHTFGKKIKKNSYFSKDKNILLEPSCSLRRLFKIYIGILSALIQIDKIKLKKISPEILHNCLIKAFSFNAVRNLIIGQQVADIVKASKPEFLITTFEGHAWERLCFKTAREVFPDIKCLGYQFAPIFKYQHAIKRKIEQSYDPDIVLTSGYIPKLQLLDRDVFSEDQILVLGSGRFLKKEKNLETRSNDKKQKCLVAPEANLRECILLFGLTLKCTGNVDFIWRLPPMITIDNLISYSDEFRDLPKFISISKSNLICDIFKSNYVLYRGSSVAINCVAMGLNPIYYQLDNEFIIDPLYEINDRHHYVRSVEELTAAFLSPVHKVEKEKTAAYANGIYSPLNIEIFEKLI